MLLLFHEPTCLLMGQSEKEEESEEPRTAQSKSELENSLATLCWRFSSHFPAETTTIPSPTLWLHTEHLGCQLLMNDVLHHLRAGRTMALLAWLGSTSKKSKISVSSIQKCPSGRISTSIKAFSESNQAVPSCWLHGHGNFPGKWRLEALLEHQQSVSKKWDLIFHGIPLILVVFLLCALFL